ncbi:MAG: site-2 protease family protein [Cyanobacteria bacterium P01_A01_bin.84]
MQKNWKIGSLFGIPLFLDPLWFLILALATLNFGIAYQEFGTVLAWGVGVTMALLLFGCVLLHELGHSLAAKSQGIKVNSITLFLFGGIAAIEEESNTPFNAFQVAIAGPLVSIGLFFILRLAAYTLPETSAISAMLIDLSRINLVLALFNLIPGLPLDGGQILKAALWKVTGNRFQAIRLAARAGQILGYGAIALGLFIDYQTGELITGLWIAMLGWFGIRNATAYERMSGLQETLLKLTAADTMTRDFRVVDADQTLRAFADNYLLDNTRPQVYYASSDGRYRGLVSLESFRSIERSQWEIKTVNDIVIPLTEIPSVIESTIMAETINKLETPNLFSITVLSPAGAVSGTIDKGDIIKALAQKLKLRISEAEIKRVKAEGTYPPGLNLDLLAKSVKK